MDIGGLCTTEIRGDGEGKENEINESGTPHESALRPSRPPTPGHAIDVARDAQTIRLTLSQTVLPRDRPVSVHAVQNVHPRRGGERGTGGPGKAEEERRINEEAQAYCRGDDVGGTTHPIGDHRRVDAPVVGRYSGGAGSPSYMLYAGDRRLGGPPRDTGECCSETEGRDAGGRGREDDRERRMEGDDVGEAQCAWSKPRVRGPSTSGTVARSAIVAHDQQKRAEMYGRMRGAPPAVAHLQTPPPRTAECRQTGGEGREEDVEKGSMEVHGRHDAMRTTVVLLGDGRESVEVGQGKGQRFDSELGDVWERGRARKLMTPLGGDWMDVIRRRKRRRLYNEIHDSLDDDAGQIQRWAEENLPLEVSNPA
ncbi:hypothetical protein B0H13DRAFT_1927796 [Mycena leptocephala]|nr:hypothetical protein B0H13DRAFT_1927796 [Mycena leptocephala]